MNWKLVCPFIALGSLFYCQLTKGLPGDVENDSGEEKRSVCIEIRSGFGVSPDSIDLSVYPTERVLGNSRLNQPDKKFVSGDAKWSFRAERPVTIGIVNLVEHDLYGLAEPGDSIVISHDGDKLHFTGRGAEKLQLQYEIASERAKMEEPAGAKFRAASLDDYLQWNARLNNQLDYLIALIDSYKDRISDFAYTFIKFYVVGRIEEDRKDKFSSLRWQAEKFDISRQRLCEVFDSTMYGKHALWMRSVPMYHSSYYAFNRVEVFRKHAFNMEADSLSSDAKRRVLYYEHGKKAFKDRVLEEFLVTLMVPETIYEVGFTPEAEMLLKRYYSESKCEECKAYVKAHELKARTLKDGQPAPDFVLTDVHGNAFTKEKLKHKVALMDFWFTGCIGCAQMMPALKRIKNEFKEDSNVVFISVSVDKDKKRWMESIEGGKYTDKNATNVYVGEQGRRNEIVKNYNVMGYPSLFLLDVFGRIVENPLPDPTHDNGDSLVDLIGRQLILMKDGPYMLYEDNSLVAYFFDGKSIGRERIDRRNFSFKVPADRYRSGFDVTLRPSLSNEPAEFLKPGKLLCLSDIEGNLNALSRLLQVNGAIDSNFNWTFGDGHLVLNGDIFDRGEQVTECLWLIYSLEEKAKAAGGYVHFILGNHEIMNLSGIDKYVQEKYKGNASRIGKRYTELYDSNSELGRWLRTKNIMERIGDLLFVHGGISKEVSDLSLSIEQINTLARNYYDRDSIAESADDEKVRLLYDTKLSPFWHRSYYLAEEKKTVRQGDTLRKTPVNVIDSALHRFNVRKIITGHTIVADTISAHYDGKVINTDTRHAKGKSEALLIENDEFYRVNNNGEKTVLLAPGNKSD